jgi:hypothetical protein
MLDPYQSQYIDLLQNPQELNLTDLQKEMFYYEVVKRAAQDPDFGKELDAKVASNATLQGFEPETVVRVLTNGPYFRSQIQSDEQGVSLKSVPDMMASHVTPIAGNLLRVQARKEAISAMQEWQLNKLNYTPAKTATLFFTTGYSILNSAEKALFAVTPLPMKAIKSGMQNVAFPLGLAAIASNIPAVNNAIGYGGDLIGSAARAVTNGGLSALGTQFMSVMPKGMGIHSTLGVVGTGISFVAGNLSQASGKILGQTGAAIAVGKVITESAKQVFLNRENIFRAMANPELLTQGKLKIQESIAGAQRAIGRAKLFINSQSGNIRLFGLSYQLNHNKEHTMSNENQQLPENFGLPIAEGLTAQKIEQIGDTQAGLAYNNAEYARQQLNDLNRRASEPGMDYLRTQPEYITYQQQYTDSRFSLQERLQRLAGEGRYQAPNGAQIISRPAAAEQVSPEQPTDKIEPTNGNSAEVTASPESAQDAFQRQLEVNGTAPPEKDEPAIQASKSQETPEDTIAAARKLSGQDKSSEEQEFQSFALDLKNKLAQRGVNVENFQIDYDGKQVFKSLANGADIRNSSMTKEAHDALKQIQSDYTNFKGEVKITAGGKTLLHVKNGELLHDAIGMAQSQAKVEVRSAENTLYNNASRQVTSEGMQRLQDIGVNAFAGGAEKQQVMEALKQDPSYKKQVDERGETYADTQLAAVVAAAQSVNARNYVAQHQTQQSQEKTKETAIAK